MSDLISEVRSLALVGHRIPSLYLPSTIIKYINDMITDRAALMIQRFARRTRVMKKSILGDHGPFKLAGRGCMQWPKYAARHYRLYHAREEYYQYLLYSKFDRRARGLARPLPPPVEYPPGQHPFELARSDPSGIIYRGF